jgi:hypothetical protein
LKLQNLPPASQEKRFETAFAEIDALVSRLVTSCRPLGLDSDEVVVSHSATVAKIRDCWS